MFHFQSCLTEFGVNEQGVDIKFFYYDWWFTYLNALWIPWSPEIPDDNVIKTCKPILARRSGGGSWKIIDIPSKTKGFSAITKIGSSSSLDEWNKSIEVTALFINITILFLFLDF